MNGGDPSKVEDVLAQTDVAGAAALFRGDVSQTMFNANAQTQSRAAGWRGLQQPELLLQAFILSDRDGAAFAVRGVSALCSEAARTADVWVKLDDMSWLEWLGLAGGTRDREPSHVELEVCLLEEVGFSTREPRLADDLGASLLRIIDQRAVDVAAINVELLPEPRGRLQAEVWPAPLGDWLESLCTPG